MQYVLFSSFAGRVGGSRYNGTEPIEHTIARLWILLAVKHRSEDEAAILGPIVELETCWKSSSHICSFPFCFELYSPHCVCILQKQIAASGV